MHRMVCWKTRRVLASGWHRLTWIGSEAVALTTAGRNGALDELMPLLTAILVILCCNLGVSNSICYGNIGGAQL